MPLAKCPNCGKKMPNSAPFCPCCGFPAPSAKNAGPQPKKIISSRTLFIGLLILAIGLTVSAIISVHNGKSDNQAADIEKAVLAEEQEAYEKRGPYTKTAAFRGLKWWASQDEVRAAEERSADSDPRGDQALAMQKARELNLAMPADLPPFLRYETKRDGGKMDLQYVFAHDSKGLCFIIINAMSLPGEDLERLRKSVLDFLAAGLAEPLPENEPLKEGLISHEWTTSNTRLSLIQKQYQISGQPASQLVVLMTQPGYGGAGFPQTFLAAWLHNYVKAVEKANGVKFEEIQ